MPTKTPFEIARKNTRILREAFLKDLKESAKAWTVKSLQLGCSKEHLPYESTRDAFDWLGRLEDGGH